MNAKQIDKIGTLTKFLVEQAASIGEVGEIGLFGDALTPEDIAHAMSELARVANIYADSIRSGDLDVKM